MTPIKSELLVLGFLFNTKGSHVLLIIKDHPADMKGRLNGLGGHVEKAESTKHALEREFGEESHLNNPAWIYFCLWEKANCQIACFCAFDDALMKSATNSLCVSRVVTKEPIGIFCVDELNRLPLVEGVSWLVPMALSFLNNITRPAFVVEENNV